MIMHVCEVQGQLGLDLGDEHCQGEKNMKCDTALLTLSKENLCSTFIS